MYDIQSIEWLQLLVAICGLVISVAGMADALWDASLPSTENGSRWRFVFARSRNEIKRLCIQGIAVGIGIESLTIRVPYGEMQIIELTLTRWGLIGMSALVSIGTLWDWIDRRAQRRIYSSQYVGPDRRRHLDAPPTSVEVSTTVTSSDGAAIVVEPPQAQS